MMIVNGPYGPVMYAPPYVPFYPTPSPQIERDKVRVSFRDGKVVAIERVLKIRVTDCRLDVLNRGLTQVMARALETGA